MKKYIFCFLLFAVCLPFSLKAQTGHGSIYVMETIYTPMGSSVSANRVTTDAPLSYRLALDSSNRAQRPYSTFLTTVGDSYSTCYFNCHGYAWRYSENESSRWIGDADAYITDGSYIRVTAQHYPGKISWNSNNSHSAVTTANGEIIEKVSDGPLMQHSLQQSMYGTSDLRYYVKHNTAFNITGPNPVFTGSTVTFTLVPAPHANVNILWGSSVLTKISSSSASATFTANSPGSANVTASIVINGSTPVQLASKTVSVMAPVTVSGPSPVCSGYSATFTASSLPSGFTWTCSSNLTPGAASGNNKTFTAQSNTTGSAWVAINLGTVEVIRQNLTVGVPPLVIATPQNRTVSLNTGITVTPSVPGMTSYRWAFASGTSSSASLDYPYGAYATARFTSAGTYALYGYGIRSCGESNSASVMYVITASSSSYSMSAYPNPASNILNVEIEEMEQEAEAVTANEGLAQANLTGQAGSQKTVVKQQPVYEIRLFNALGTLVSQTSTIGNSAQINVDNLSNGIYILHVYDGSGAAPKTQQIVVAH